MARKNQRGKKANAENGKLENNANYCGCKGQNEIKMQKRQSKKLTLTLNFTSKVKCTFFTLRQT